MSAIGKLFRIARRKRGLSRVDVVKAAGWRNIDRGLRRLDRIEGGDQPFPLTALLQRFAPILGLDEAAMLAAMSEDFLELDQPVPPQVVVRLIPGVYTSLQLPGDCPTEEAIEIAAAYSARKSFKVCVVLSKIRGLYIEPDGSRFEAFGLPYSSIGRLTGLGDLADKLVARRSWSLSSTRLEPPQVSKESP